MLVTGHVSQTLYITKFGPGIMGVLIFFFVHESALNAFMGTFIYEIRQKHLGMNAFRYTDIPETFLKSIYRWQKVVPQITRTPKEEAVFYVRQRVDAIALTSMPVP